MLTDQEGMELEPKKVGRVALLTESYPPQIDGVSVASCNYARYLQEDYDGAVVIAPNYRNEPETETCAPVVRYLSLDFQGQLGYPVGVPTSPAIVRRLEQYPFSVIHMMSPMVSNMLGRELRMIYDVPQILTYHTKFDEDIYRLVHSRPIAKTAISIMMSNINTCDEVWVVSHGAEENLRHLGYDRETFLMPNGTDLARRRSTEEEIREVCAQANIPEGVPVLLFAGRIVRIKGLDLILEAVRILKDEGADFRMIFVGDGMDKKEVIRRAEELRVSDKCCFVPAEHDRERLRAWYTRADLFVFPSNFDTNGLVVREAAAAGTPSLLLRGSAAAEGIVDNVNGFLTEGSGKALAERIRSIWNRRDFLRSVGENASEQIYLSWKDAVAMAYERYAVVTENYKAGKYPPRKSGGDWIFRTQGRYMGLAVRRRSKRRLRSRSGWHRKKKS